MATSGLLVKNAAVSLVNGVYNKYSDNSKGRRWLSSDRLCMMHFSEQSCYNKVDVDLDSHVTPEMTTKRYYKYNTVERTYTPVNLVMSSDQTINDQIGNNDKTMVAGSLDETPRKLNMTEIALGQTRERIYWLHDNSASPGEDDLNILVNVTVQFTSLQEDDRAYIKIASDEKVYAENGTVETMAILGDQIEVGIEHSNHTLETTTSTVEYPAGDFVSYKCDTTAGIVLTNDHNEETSYRSSSTDIYVGPTMLQNVYTVETRKKETITRGTVDVLVRFFNVPDGDRAYVQLGDSEEKLYAVDGNVNTQALMHTAIKACIEHTEPASGDTPETVTVKEATSSVQYALDRVVSFKLDASKTELTLVNDNTYDQISYVAVLYYSTPIYLLATETNMNHWSIARVSLNETGLDIQDELYVAFAENNGIDPWSGLPWICVDGGNSTVDTRVKVEYWDESSVKSTTETTTDADGAVRTVTSFINIITGETYTDTQVVREKTIFNQTDVTRYDYVNLAIGKIYRFRFVSEFAKLGWIPGDTTQPLNAGIYKVDSIMSYYDSVTGRIDLYVNLYEPCGVPKSTFDADKKRFADTVIYRLVDPTDESKIYFMPQIFIEGQPDASVLKYNKLLMMIDLGIQPNSNTVAELTDTSHPSVAALNRIDDMKVLLLKVLEKEYGLAPTATNPLIKYSVYGHSWLTDDAFKSIEADRKTVQTLSEVDFNTLFKCDESNKWYLENQKLRAKLQNQEALLTRLLNKRTGN